MAFGDKVYDYNFYGLPDSSRVWGTVGVGGYAALTYLNVWGLYMGPPISEFFTDGIYWEHDGTTSDTYGKPLNTTIALWKISRNCSFACNAVFSAETGSTLKPHYEVNVHSSDAPLAMCAVDTHGGAYGNFSTDPRNRWAYDVSNENNGSYSAMIYDIVYNTMCLQVNAITVNLASPSAQPATRDLASLAAYIDGDAENRFVQIIRPYLYRGASTPRYRTADGIPPQGAHTTYNGIPLIDTLTDRPIPSTETHLKDYIKDGHSERRGDVVYNPFVQRLEEAIFTEPADATNATAQLDIGFNRWLSMNNLRNGIRAIPNTTYRITAQYYRCNYDVKDFSDVKYQWENIVMNNSNGMILPDGLDLTLLPASTTFRVMTRLRILDAKGGTIGKATELAVKHEIAFIGMYFVDSISRAENSELGSGDGVGVYLPLYSGGVPNGEYVTGTAIPLQPHANAQSVSEDTFHYDDAQVDTDAGFPDEVTAIPRFGRTYLCTLADIEFMNYNLKTMDWSAENREELFFGQNPYDFIISATAYPLVDYPLSPAATLHDIELGKVNLNELPDKVGDCTGYPIMGGVVIYPEPFGELYVKPYYSDSKYELSFLDYEPFTSIYLVLPYADVVSIPPEVFMGNTIGIRMGVDFMSGNVIYFIYVKETGILFTTTSGNMATEIPISGLDYTEYKKAELRAAKNMTNTFFDTTSEVLGHAAGASVSSTFHNETGANAQTAMAVISGAKGAINIAFDAYEIAHTAPSPVAVSAGSASLGTAAPQDAKLFILRPKLPEDFNVTEYKLKYGKSTASTGPLNSSTGFTQMLNPILDGIDCTAEEKMMIVDALKGGVIL